MTKSNNQNNNSNKSNKKSSSVSSSLSSFYSKASSTLKSIPNAFKKVKNILSAKKDKSIKINKQEKEKQEQQLNKHRLNRPYDFAWRQAPAWYELFHSNNSKMVQCSPEYEQKIFTKAHDVYFHNESTFHDENLYNTVMPGDKENLFFDKESCPEWNEKKKRDNDINELNEIVQTIIDRDDPTLFGMMDWHTSELGTHLDEVFDEYDPTHFTYCYKTTNFDDMWSLLDSLISQLLKGVPDDYKEHPNRPKYTFSFTVYEKSRLFKEPKYYLFTHAVAENHCNMETDELEYDDEYEQIILDDNYFDLLEQQKEDGTVEDREFEFQEKVDSYYYSS